MERTGGRQRYRTEGQRDAQLVPHGDGLQHQLSLSLHAEEGAIAFRNLVPTKPLPRLEIEAVHEQLIRLQRVKGGGRIVREPRVADQVHALHEASGGGGIPESGGQAPQNFAGSGEAALP